MEETMELLDGGGFVLDTREEIAVCRLLALRSALKLQNQGIRMAARGPSPATIIKKEFGLTGNNGTLLLKYEALLRERGILR